MEDGAELFRLPAPHTIPGVNVSYQVTVTVAFEEEGPAHGRPLTQTLEELIDFTEQTIGLFDRFL